MVTDWMQAWADVAQAGIVVISIIAAGWKYLVTRKNHARIAVVQMFNVADEFPTIVSDKVRYRVMLAQQKQTLAAVKELPFEETIDEPNWDEMRDEVRAFRVSFRDTLQALWSALDDTSWGWKKYQNETQAVLNSASNVDQSISTLLDTLSGDDHSNVQSTKQALATFLDRFTQSLASLAAHRNIMKLTEAANYDPVLREYVEMPKTIKEKLKNEIGTLNQDLNSAQSNGEITESDQLEKITEKLNKPDSHLNKCGLSEEAKAELKKLAKANALISFRLNKINDKFEDWIPMEQVSQVRRAMFASLNPYLSQETNSEEWVTANIKQLRTQMVHDELHKLELMQYSAQFAVRRALQKKDGSLSKSTALSYNIVGPEFGKFLLKHPQVTVEDILAIS